MPGPRILERGLILNPHAESEILHVSPDFAVAIRCKCAAGPIFIVRLTQPMECPSCGAAHRVEAVEAHTKHTGEMSFNVAIRTFKVRPPDDLAAPPSAN